jgi:chromosome segregation ATPase
MTRMTPEQAAERREAIMALTASLRNQYPAFMEQLREVNAAMAEIDYPCARLTRLSDKKWDLEAAIKGLDQQIEAKVDAYIAQQ